MVGHIQGIYTQEGNYLMDLRQNESYIQFLCIYSLVTFKGLMTQGVFPQIWKWFSKSSDYLRIFSNDFGYESMKPWKYCDNFGTCWITQKVLERNHWNFIRIPNKWSSLHLSDQFLWIIWFLYTQSRTDLKADVTWRRKSL